MMLSLGIIIHQFLRDNISLCVRKKSTISDTFHNALATGRDFAQGYSREEGISKKGDIGT